MTATSAPHAQDRWPPWTAEWIPSPRRVRVLFGGVWVADSRRVMLLRQHGFLPVYYVPEADVRTDLLAPTSHTTTSPYKGVAAYWSLAAGGRVAESAVWSYPDPKPGSPDTRGYYSFDWHSMEAWFEEDEQVFVHARDPCVRVDAVRSSRVVEVLLGGTTVASTSRPVLLFETGLVTRYYVPPADVRLELLVPSDTYSFCPYKGRALYYSLLIGGTLYEDAAWSYPSPLAAVGAVAGHLSFWNERDDTTIVVDGEPVERLGVRESGDGGELLYPSRRFFAVPPPASMRGAGAGGRQHDFARPNGRAEGPPEPLVDMEVERAGGRRVEGIPGAGRAAPDPDARSELPSRASFTFGP